jgi:hypothetical protein
MLGLLPPTSKRSRETTTARKQRSATDEPLIQTTESLMRNAAAVRRADAAPPQRLRTIGVRGTFRTTRL